VTLALVEASGCAVSRGDLGMSFNEKDISAIKKGSATQANVVRLLGAPDNVSSVTAKSSTTITIP
jgi:hypothetical protein